MEFDINLVDFPFVCRICLIRGDLRLFEEEDCLWNLFLAITKIEVSSTVEFPRNICNECIDKLQDISRFIDVSKYNVPGSGENLVPKTGSIENHDTVESGTYREAFEIKEEISVYIYQFCRICSSPKSLILCEEKSSLMELFRTLTNIDVESDINCLSKSSICNKCVNELEKISSFIDLLFCSNRKLQNAISRNVGIKTESYSDGNASNVGLSRCDEMKVDLNEIKVETSSDENSCTHENSDTSTMIDIKEENFDSELVASVERNYQNRLELGSQHLLVHTEDKPYKCDCCEKRYTRAINLKQHMPSHTGEMPFKCDYCKKGFTIKCYLKRHVLTHRDEKPFKCDSCGKQFTRAYHLKLHMLTHTGEKPYKCDYCEKCTYCKSSLRKHMLTHIKERPFKCDCCEKSFNVKSRLKLHMLDHTGERPFKCDACEKSFPSKNRLKMHMFTHTGKRPFKCDSCERSFVEKRRLKEHMLNHTGEKAFKCDCCEKQFIRADYLKRHMVTHTGEKPFKCDDCGKSFSAKSHLKMHMFIHTGEKPYKCDYCQKSFYCKSNLRKHMLTHRINAIQM